MNLERLRAVQAEEREADSLRPLPDSFYRDVVNYIEDRRDARAAAAEEADDPFGAEDVRRLTDEIETAEEVAEAIYERRVGKLVKRASLAAAGIPAEDDGLTTEEAELFTELVDLIEAHREALLTSFEAGEGTAGGVTSTSAVGSADPADSADSAGPALSAEAPSEDQLPGPDEERNDSDDVPADGTTTGGGGTAHPDSGSGEGAPPGPPDDPPVDDGGSPDGSGRSDRSDDTAESTDGGDRVGTDERMTLRITRDVGEVFGIDERVYDLAAEDVVTLPATNAKPLVDRDAAEEIE